MAADWWGDWARALGIDPALIPPRDVVPRAAPTQTLTAPLAWTQAIAVGIERELQAAMDDVHRRARATVTNDGEVLN